MAADHQCSLSEEQTMIPFTIEVSPTQAVMANGSDLTIAGQSQGQPGADSPEQQQVRTGCWHGVHSNSIWQMQHPLIGSSYYLSVDLPEGLPAD